MQPDVFVVPEELIPARYTTGWGHVRWLLLAVEILSPATERVDRRVKRDFIWREASTSTGSLIWMRA